MSEKVSVKPERHPKGWGYEDWIVNIDLYCGKILHFYKEKQCSLHYHKIKEETFHILSGKFLIILYDSLEAYGKKEKQEIILLPGSSLHLWPGRLHRVFSIEEGDIIEFSTQHFEDDSYRVEPGDSQK